MNAPPEIETTSAPDHLKAVEFCRESYANIQNELAKVVVGQSGVLEEILIAIFTRSHALLVGVPGPGQDADDLHAGADVADVASSASSSRPT